ncbi:hypothetical protein Anas_00267 [Armadillidium nasatum]|uniref:glutathione transferase n=1 Tax=Armadillidium nasatum TaxID=96803 RepID=A0A5N5TG18_9CRUS|nr:hypothetical protein Anas_00267 [Armadillidium nasatum]
MSKSVARIGRRIVELEWNLGFLNGSINLLEYTGTEYTEKFYQRGPAPDFDGSCWFDEKYTHGMHFPNQSNITIFDCILPYYIDGDLNITQSHAILKYLGRKHDLVGKTDAENIRVDMTEHEAADMRLEWMNLVYRSKEDFDKFVDEYKTKILLPRLKNLSKYLDTHPWFAGDHITTYALKWHR